jgi:cytoskeleton protein RodZ
MSDQVEKENAAAPTPGGLLKQERERHGRTVQQVAADLHIGVYMVEAIEANQFSVLGAPVFARGHLRKYAALLGVPVDRVQELYQGLSDLPANPELVPGLHRESEPSIPMSPDSKQRMQQRPAQWTFAIAGGALAVTAALTWFLFSNSDKEPILAAPTATPAVVTTSATGTDALSATQMPAVESAVQLPLASKNEGATKPIVAASNAATLAPAAKGKLRLRFSFSQESWVEVYDSRGTRLLYDVGSAGQTRNVDVDPPAQVVLGQAAAVSTEVNGRVVAVPERRIANQVARFSVGADGTVQ